MKRSAAIVAVFVSLFFGIAVQAFGQWEEVNGQGGTLIRALIVNGTTVFAGSETGVIRSTDNGATWRESGNGLSGASVVVFAISRTIVYAGTDGNGVYQSSDNGDHWFADTAGISTRKITAIAVSGGSIFAGTDGPLIRSTDGGASWKSVPNVGFSIYSLGVLDSLVLVASGTGIFRSTDNGSTWKKVNFSSAFITSMTTSGGVFYGGTANGLYRSTNGGTNWIIMSMNLNIYSLAFVDTVLFAGTDEGILRSKDHGLTWTASEYAYKSVLVFALASGGKELFASTDGVSRSDDYGANWIPLNTSLKQVTIDGVAAIGQVLFAANPGFGVFRSDDNGRQWRNFDTGLTDHNVISLTSIGQTLLAGTDSGIYRFLEGSANWIHCSLPTNTLFINTLYMDGLIAYAASNSDGIFRSDNDGQSWKTFGMGSPNDHVTSFASIGSLLFAGVDSSSYGMVFRTSDPPTYWEHADSLLKDYSIRALTSLGSILFASSGSNGVFRSIDSGKSWKQASNGLPASAGKAFAISGQTLFLATLVHDKNIGNIFFSTDSGTTWKRIDSGLPYDIGTIVIIGKYLYAGTSNGVWRRGLSDFIGSSGVAKSTSIGSGDLHGYPNPFSQYATICFHTDKSSPAQISICNLLGSEVARLFTGSLEGGEHSFTWDAHTMPPGMYICMVKTGSEVKNLPLVLVK